MALEFKENSNMLVIHIPNSEASVDAQHNGGKDTTVGSYYMSEMQPEVHEFLNEFEGDFYIDLVLVVRNAKTIFNELIDKNLENAFKKKLIPQKNAIEFLEWLINNEGPLFKIPNPTVNENNKYLKFDNLNQAIETFRALCLGELCDICIQKIGINGYILYMDKSPRYYDLINKTAYKWVKNND